jgi:hypothetical protein
MHASLSLRRIALIVAPALLGLAWLAPAAQAGDFQASSTFAIIASHGTHNELTGSGRARPGGKFTVVLAIQQLGNGDARGEFTMDFGNGDTLSFYNAVEWDPATGLLTGPYIVTGGTGKLAGASGSGTTVVDPAGDGTGEFYLEGTLSD